MLPSLSELAPACFELLLQVGAGLAAPTSARSHLRSGRTNFATARTAFGAFARQGHLDRPMLVVTSRGSGLASRNARTRPESELSHERRARLRFHGSHPSRRTAAATTSIRKGLSRSTKNATCIFWTTVHGSPRGWVKPHPRRVPIAYEACASLPASVTSLI